MSTQDLEKHVAILAGEVHALFMTLQVVLGDYSDPKYLLPKIKEAQQAGLAILEASPMPDAGLGGYQHVFGKFEDILKESVVAHDKG